MFAKEKFYPNNLVQYNFNPKQYMSKKCWSSFVNVVIVVVVAIVVIVVVIAIVVIVVVFVIVVIDPRDPSLKFGQNWVSNR